MITPDFSGVLAFGRALTPVSVESFGAVGDGVTDDTAAIQAAHDYCEANLGGGVTLIAGAHHKCNGGLIWNPRLVAMDMYQATLDCSGIVPANVGTDLVTGDSSTFASSTGNWAFSGVTTSLTGVGVKLTNTGNSAGFGYLALTTVPGTWYMVTYVQTSGGTDLCQMNMYAHVNQNSIALEYCTAATNCYFLFKAVYTTTYLTMRLSTAIASDFATVGSITCKVCVPPAVYLFDRTTNNAAPAMQGWGYAVNDVLTGVGGIFSIPVQITVTGVDGDGRITNAQITDVGAYTVFPTNPVSVTGGSGRLATFNIGINTSQFGHDAFPFENGTITGPGRSLNYVVDTNTDYSVYSSAYCSYGLLLNTPNISGNRNSTSARGTIRNLVIKNFWAPVDYHDQAYLSIMWDVGIANSNFGWLSTAGQNAGENVSIFGGFVTGCDVNLCAAAHVMKFTNTSFDFPKQASIRITGQNAGVVLNECHIEQSPPGQSTQIVDPIALTGKASFLTMTGGELMITGGYTAGSYPTIISTKLASQAVTLSNVLLNNLVTSYLISGPGITTIPVPSRTLQFPTIPQLLNDQGSSASQLDAYWFGDFESPVVAAGTRPRGLISIGSHLDDLTFQQTYTSRFASNLMAISLSNALAHTGAQSLKVVKSGNNGTNGIVYFMAPARPGYQMWWTFWINVPTPTGAPAHSVVTMAQGFTQNLGVETLLVGAPDGTTNQAAGYPFDLAGPFAGYGQLFAGNTQGGIQVSAVNGTNGWQFNNIDVFNHGTAKVPFGATHCYLTLDFTGFDGALWGAVSAYIDDIQCWAL